MDEYANDIIEAYVDDLYDCEFDDYGCPDCGDISCQGYCWDELDDPCFDDDFEL